MVQYDPIIPPKLPKGGFNSEDTEKSLPLQHKYSISLSLAENLNKLFTVLGGKFKFSAQDSNLEYLSLGVLISLFPMPATEAIETIFKEFDCKYQLILKKYII